MAPRHTQGCGGAAYRATAHLWCPTNQELVCWFLFPPPAYPTLHLFGFRANALNSHSPPDLPGFDPGSGLERFGGPPREPSFRGSHTLGVGFGSGFRVFSGLPPYPCLVDPEISSFQATWRGGLASGPPERPAADPPNPRSLGLGFLNLVNHRKGEGVP